MTVLQRLFGRPAARSSHDAALADPLIARLFAATDKRLVLVKGARERLREPVAKAFRELHMKIARIPGPAEIAAASWAHDETVHTLFAHGDDAARAYSENGDVRDFFAIHPSGDCFGLLALEQVERRVLAPALQGESVQTEVARTTVSFTEPQVLAPSGNDESVRDELVKRAIDYLGLRALQAVGTLRTQKHELEQERALLQAQLQLARRRGTGFGSIGTQPEAAGGKTVAILERDLERTVAELERAASRQLLPLLVDELCKVLAAHDEHLSLEPSTLCLDSMNFVVPASPQAITPRVSILKLAQRGPFAVLVARFPREGLRTENRLAEAAKYL